jgi:ATP-dependent DNA ligase
MDPIFMTFIEGKNSLPTLFKTDKTGKSREWKIFRKGNVVHTEHGVVGGKIVISKPTIYEAVYEGQKNAMDEEENAIDKMFRKWSAQLDKDYSVESSDKDGMRLYEIVKERKENSGGKNTNIFKLNGVAVSGKRSTAIVQKADVIKPMLAHTWNPEKKTMNKYIKFDEGVYVDAKLDGIRCISYLNSEGNVIMATRNGKQFPFFMKIRGELQILLDDNPKLILDGEIYAHTIDGAYNVERKRPYLEAERFQFIQGAAGVGRTSPHPSEDILQYFVFDIIDYEKDQRERNRTLEDLFLENSNLPHIVKIERSLVYSWGDAKDIFGTLMERGYEGIVLRASSAMYEGGRSLYLRKWKEMEDEEAEIIGFKDGQGKDKGKVIWRARFDSGVEFDVRPKATDDEREYMFEHGEDYIGKFLTVQYQEKNASGAPKFPVGKGVREEE